MEYLERGEEAMEQLGLTWNRRRYLRYAAKSYRIALVSEAKHLIYVESTGAISICIVEAEVPRFLQAAHKDHRHYSDTLTLDYLIGRAY